MNNQINIKLSPRPPVWEFFFSSSFLEQMKSSTYSSIEKAKVAFHRHKGEGALGAVAPQVEGKMQMMASFGIIRLYNLSFGFSLVAFFIPKQS